MRRCGRAPRFIALREHAIAKIHALLLITLILLPFTAPFKTYDLAGSRGDSSHEWLAKDKIGSDEEPRLQAAILRI